MKLETFEAVFKKRINRFVGTVLLNQQLIEVYIPNTGSLKTVLFPESTVFLRKIFSKKFLYSLVIVLVDSSYVGVDTHIPNKLFQEFYSTKNIKKEIVIGNSRIDFLLEDTYVEVKNVTMKEKKTALFPDAVSLRARKHLEVLETLRLQHKKTVLFFCIQRSDVKFFSPSDIDLVYATRLKELSLNLKIQAFVCHVSPSEIYIQKEIPVIFS
jgi:sugar fermentation stimulation protein A